MVAQRIVPVTDKPQREPDQEQKDRSGVADKREVQRAATTGPAAPRSTPPTIQPMQATINGARPPTVSTPRVSPRSSRLTRRSPKDQQQQPFSVVAPARKRRFIGTPARIPHIPRRGSTGQPAQRPNRPQIPAFTQPVGGFRLNRGQRDRRQALSVGGRYAPLPRGGARAGSNRGENRRSARRRAARRRRLRSCMRSGDAQLERPSDRTCIGQAPDRSPGAPRQGHGRKDDWSLRCAQWQVSDSRSRWS